MTKLKKQIPEKRNKNMQSQHILIKKALIRAKNNNFLYF
jgi:hypothetical protein